jgi:hypothetical protein
MKHKYRNFALPSINRWRRKHKSSYMQTISICTQTTNNQLISEAVQGDEQKFWLHKQFCNQKEEKFST